MAFEFLYNGFQFNGGGGGSSGGAIAVALSSADGSIIATQASTYNPLNQTITVYFEATGQLAHGLAPYSTTAAYLIGDLIVGDGTNGKIGQTLICNTNVTGAFVAANWDNHLLAGNASHLFNTLAGVGINIANITGNKNTVSGYGAAAALTSSSNVVAIGYNAFNAGIAGIGNSTAVGYQAGLLATGSGNQLFGTNAGAAVTSGANNTYLGGFTGTGLATSSNYVVASDGAANITSWMSGTGNSNVSIGALALPITTSATGCVAVGVQALQLSTGNSVTGIGNAALQNSTGGANSALGYNAGKANTSGTNNSYFGQQAGLSNQTGSGNVIIGSNTALLFNGGSSCTVTGASAMATGVNVSNNTIYGSSALNAGTGANNSIFGANAAAFNITSSNCSYFGAYNGSGNIAATSHRGSWAAATNTPTLSNASIEATGHWYLNTSSGTNSVDFGAGAISFNQGDIVLSTGSIWTNGGASDAYVSNLVSWSDGAGNQVFRALGTTQSYQANVSWSSTLLDNSASNLTFTSKTATWSRLSNGINVTCDFTYPVTTADTNPASIKTLPSAPFGIISISGMATGVGAIVGKVTAGSGVVALYSAATGLAILNQTLTLSVVTLTAQYSS